MVLMYVYNVHKVTSWEKKVMKQESVYHVRARIALSVMNSQTRVWDVKMVSI